MNRQSQRMLAVTALVVCALCATGAEAQGNWQPGDFGSMRFYLGISQPRADSQYWDEIFDAFTGSPSSFEDMVFGADYLWGTSKNSGLLFGVSFYDGATTQAYKDYVDSNGGDISHNTTLKLGDLSAAYVWRFGRSGVRPYIGAGAGLLWWRLSEEGYFVDLSDEENLPIVFASYRADGTTWELFALAGLDVPLGFRWSFFVEGRLRWAEAELNKDFAGFGTIDLSGYQLAGGFSWNF